VPASTAFQSTLPRGHSQRKIPVHAALRGATVKAKLGSVGWHTFRHIYRFLLDDTGAPIGVQQKLMSHGDIGTGVL
jgi:integrase